MPGPAHTIHKVSIIVHNSHILLVLAIYQYCLLLITTTNAARPHNILITICIITPLLFVLEPVIILYISIKQSVLISVFVQFGLLVGGRLISFLLIGHVVVLLDIGCLVCANSIAGTVKEGGLQVSIRTYYYMNSTKRRTYKKVVLYKILCI